MCRGLISLVEDDPAVGRATARLLRARNFKGEGFSSAEDFLKSGHLDNTSCLIPAGPRS